MAERAIQAVYPASGFPFQILIQSKPLSKALSNLLHHRSRTQTSPTGLKIRWYSRWNAILDEAIPTLSGAYDYPLELYRLICQNTGASQKKIGLITHQGEPVGIAGLSKNRHHWEPVTQWLLPGTVFPIWENYLPQALDQLNLDLWVGFWRPRQPPVYTKNVRYLEATPTHRMSCSANPEEFWRETGKFKAIRACRNRCKNFTYGINLPGAAEWTIRNWSARWGREEQEMSLSDRLLIAHYLESLGMHYTISMLDQGEFIGGATVIVHGRDLVAGVNYRRPDYDWHGVGDRLLDLVFTWAAESNYRTFDLGGGQEYKTKWAPQEGERWTVNICPGRIYHTKRLAHWLQSRLKRAPK